MNCVILASDHVSSPDETFNQGIPDVLLPDCRGSKPLDRWCDAIRQCSEIKDVILVTNADTYRYFERWAGAAKFPLENIINDGSTLSYAAPGQLANIELAVRTKRLLNHNLLIISSSFLLKIKLKLHNLLQVWNSKCNGHVAVYSSETVQCVDVAESLPLVDSSAVRRLTNVQTLPSCCFVDIYCLRHNSLQHLQPYLKDHPQNGSLAHFIQHLMDHEKQSVYGYECKRTAALPEQQQGSRVETSNTSDNNSTDTDRPFTARAYARVGLMGNPSDGFYGKTIAMTIRNFWAEVTIEKSASITLLPDPISDATEFGSLRDLHGVSSRDGYVGGLRLLQASCKRFFQYCSQHKICLHEHNFRIRYTTNIPRQVGLAGSSAIVTAALRCLINFFGITEHQLPRNARPQLVLDVEFQELGINAGLQDRVVQEFEGLVFMDFNQRQMEREGHGQYESIALSQSIKLPTFFLVYRSQPSDSGKMHNNVKERWRNGDSAVLTGMKELAAITDEALVAIKAAQWDKLGLLMQRNFSIRESMYGAECLGASNLSMISTARQFDACAKFPGSGGAVLGLVATNTDMEGLRAQYQQDSWVVVDVIPYFPHRGV